MSEFILKLVHIKSTKGTHVYGDDKDEAVIPNLYIRKAGLPVNPPATIMLTVQYDEN